MYSLFCKVVDKHFLLIAVAGFGIPVCLYVVAVAKVGGL